MLRRHVCLCVGLLVLAAAPIFAQTTGSIHGEVVDHDDQVLPGVAVVLTGDPIPGSQRATVSDANGEFRFPALPIGRYTMTATLAGFQDRSIDNVKVSIDAVASVTFVMHPDAFAGEIAVTGETPLVDVVSSSTTSSYDAEFIEALPTRNNFFDILSVAPAVSQPDEGNALIAGYGANMTSQSWNIDGLNVTAPGGGWLAWELNPDLVAESSFLQGAGAQYGSTFGNVWNLVTKSGTNTFHGSVSGVFQHDSLVDPNVEIDVDALPDYILWEPGGRYTIDDYYDIRGTLGGPIVKDKLWFFAGVQFINRNVTDPDGVPGIPGSGATTDRYDLKLTGQLATNHRIDVKGHSTAWDTINPPTMYMELQRALAQLTTTDMVQADYNGILSENTLLNVRVGAWQHVRDLESRTGSTEPAWSDYYVPGPPLYLGAPWWFSKREEEASQADVVLSYFADEFIKGSHEFKFGVQYYEGFDHRTVGLSGYYFRFTPYYSWRWEIMPPFVYGGDIETHGAFIDDSWRISDRLTLDLGVRWDRQQGVIPEFPIFDDNGDPTGENLPAADMIDWSNISPRIGFAWQPTGNGRTVIRGFYGRFWDGPTASAWYAPPPGRGDANTYIVAGEIWTLVDSQPVAPADELLDPNVKNPYSDEFSLSFDQQLGQEFAIGAQFIYKEIRDMIGWQIGDDGEFAPFLWDDPYTAEVEQIELIDVLVWPTLQKGNGPGPGSLAAGENYHLDYRGAILTFRKRYSKGWDLMASYTWSETTGINTHPRDRYQGGVGQGLPLFTDQIGSHPNDWYNANKLQMGDRTHMFRIQSNVDVGWGLRLSGVLNVQTGRPYMRVAQLVGPYTFTNLRVAADVSHDLVHPTSKIIDLAAQKTFQLGKRVTFDVGIQLLNVLNDDAVEYLATWDLSPGEPFVPSGWVNPRRWQIRLKLGF
jgi:hypothetical protein